MDILPTHLFLTGIGRFGADRPKELARARIAAFMFWEVSLAIWR
jgi:hypothetical protein